MTSISENPEARVLYIAQNDLKERYKKRTDRIRRYCNSLKRIGTVTHLQTDVGEQPDSTIRIRIVEVYPPEALTKAKQHLIEAFCEIKYWEKYINIQSEGTSPLSERVLKMHDLRTSCELHQFRCPECYVWWWKPVPEHKPVSKCRRCRLCLNPLKPLEQFGIGRFVCNLCGNIFFHKCQASDNRKCNNCGCRVSKPYIRPYFRSDDAKHIPITPEQQYPFNSYGNAYATTGHGYYYYPSFSYSPYSGPYNDPTTLYYDLPQPRRRNILGDFILPQVFTHNSHFFAARNPPRPANPAPMHLHPATGGFPLMCSSGTVSLRNSNTSVGSTSCVTNNHAASLANRSLAVISHPSSHPPQGDPRLPQSLGSTSPAPTCSSDFSTASGQTTMAVSLHSVPPDLQYDPSETRLPPPSSLTLQPVNSSPQSSLVTPSTSAALPLASGSASVPDEATATPSSFSSISPLSASTITQQCSSQPPSTSPSSSGLLPLFPSAISSDSNPLRPDQSVCTQPQLNSPSAKEKFPMSLADALTGLHLSETPCAQPQPETGSIPIQGLSRSDNVPVATLISPLQSAIPTSINPPLPSTAVTQSTPLPDVSTDILVNASHISSEKPPQDHCSVTVALKTTAIPLPCNSSILSDSQSDLTTPKHLDSSPAESGASAVSLAAATNSNPSLLEISAPTMLKTTTAESSNTVTVSSTAPVDANTQTGVNTSTVNFTLNPSQVLPSSSSLPQPSQQAATVSTPQATATKFESKAVQTAIPPSLNVEVNISINDNPGPVPNPRVHQANDRWTSYYDKVRIHKNPRDLKYKQVSTIHDCSGSTESSDFMSQPRIVNDPYWKFKMHHHANERQHMPAYNQYDLDYQCMYDMLEISSDEED